MRHHSTLLLECQVAANPLDRVEWYRNGQVLHVQNRELLLNDEQQQQQQIQHDNNDHHDNSGLGGDYRVDSHDVSNLDEPFSTLVTLTIMVTKLLYKSFFE